MKTNLKEVLMNKVNLQDLMNMMNECDSYNGSFENLRSYDNDEDFFRTFFEGNPMEVARRTFYGNYRYCDEFVRFNAYGNLESLSSYGYEEEIESYKEEIIDEYLQLLDDNSIDDYYIRSYIDELEEVE